MARSSTYVTAARQSDRTVWSLAEDVVNSPGRPLDSAEREHMEARFGFDFGRVRIHDDARAAESVEAAGAAAYTVGSHIALGPGRYAWSMAEGRDLLAHELTHVVQQRGGGPLVADRPAAVPAEREAAHVASLVRHQPVGGHLAAQISSQPTTLACYIPSRDRAGGATTLPGQPAPTPAPAVPLTGLARFAEVMRRTYGVRTVREGTQDEQENRLTPQGGAPPGGIHIPNWQAWTPGDADLDLIATGFDDVAWAFGGVPAVREIVFFDMHYQLDPTGAVVAEPDTGASFGAGQLTIYRKLVTGMASIPVARSDPSGRYPRVILSVGGVGATPGAPRPVPTHEQNVRRLVAHELGHGLAESAHGGANVAAATDPTMLADFQRAVGWVNGALFDIGVPAVETAIAAGTPPPAAFQITENDWNAPRWVEQPVSGYAVRGGPDEDFAESVMAYVHEPNVLLSRSPRRFRFLDSRRSRWEQGLVRPRRLGDFNVPPPGTPTPV